MNLENIPEYLKENISWCLWKYEIRKHKEIKIPINPITEGYDASTKNSKTFSSFEKAAEKLSSYDGLGIRVENNLVAIDVDHCVFNGSLNSLAKEMLATFQIHTLNLVQVEKVLEFLHSCQAQ